MTNSKNTRRALISSAFAILMCVAMLIGTTFAWFTDTAKTSVNKIQAGKLDVQLVDAEGNDLEGKTLEWVKAEGNDAVLWEPGCTYELPAVYVKNNGNLALKYKLAVTGLEGDAELLKAITFTVDGADLDTEKALAVGATSDPIVIKGHMDENAGNEYQEKSLDGIAITVVATQYTAEFDSYSNEYDKYAEAETVAVASSAELTDAIANGENVVLSQDITLDTARVDVENYNGTINLNGHQIGSSAACANGSVFNVKSGSVTIENGTLVGIEGPTGQAAAYENECDVITVRSGATVTIKDVNISVNSATGSCVYAFEGGKAYIESGVYTNNATTSGPAGENRMLVNQKDGKAQAIFISGGDFYGADPAKGDNSGSPTTFLADGFKSVEATDANGVAYYQVIAA